MFYKPLTPSDNDLFLTSEVSEQILGVTSERIKSGSEEVRIRKSFSPDYRKVSHGEKKIAQYGENERLYQELERMEQGDFLLHLRENIKIQCLDKDLYVYRFIDYRIFFALIPASNPEEQPKIIILKVASKRQLERDGLLYELPCIPTDQVPLKHLFRTTGDWLHRLYCDVFSIPMDSPYRNSSSKPKSSTSWRGDLKLRDYEQAQESPNAKNQPHDRD